MATISITKEWADGEVLLEADLDHIKEDVETFLNTTKINDDNIQNAGITASSKLIDASISTAKLANLAVTTAKIDDLAVTTGKLAASAVTTAKIADANVTKAKLASGARDGTAASKSADDTLDLTEDLIYADSTSATVTLTLPAASSSSGHEYTVIKTVAANTVVLDANSSEEINGSTTLTMYEQYESVTIWCNGSKWFIRARHIPGNSFQPVVVRAARSSTQTISTGTFTTVVFDSETIDNKSAYNASNGTFTVPTGCGGDYIVTAKLRFDGAGGFWETTEECHVNYRVNGGTAIRLGTFIPENNNGAEKSVSGADIVTLAAGDTVVIAAYQSSGASSDITGATTENHMAIVRVR